jgi:hypothetical protein
MLVHEKQVVMNRISPAASCLLLATIGGGALWLLGETAAAIAVFVVEGIAWAAVYAFGASKSD